MKTTKNQSITNQNEEFNEWEETVIDSGNAPSTNAVCNNCIYSPSTICTYPPLKPLLPRYIIDSFRVNEWIDK